MRAQRSGAARLWPGALAAALLWPVAVPARPAEPLRPAEAPPYTHVLARESTSREACEADPNRMFVTHRLGSECIAYIAAKGFESQRRAVIFLDGDIPRERMSPDSQDRILESQRRSLQAMTDRYGIPFIAVSRPGVLGSSGHHGLRRRPAEALTINAAIDRLKERHGLDTITLAGQSGGSTIAASLLTLGRSDVTCAVLGSGNLAVVELYLQRQDGDGAAPVARRVSRDVVERSFYDPAQHVSGIVRDEARRVFIIGDMADRRTPFPQQQRFAERLRAAGHHAEVLTIAGTGPDNHGASYATLPAAGLCANAASDRHIAAAVAARSVAMAARTLAPQAGMSPGSSQ